MWYLSSEVYPHTSRVLPLSDWGRGPQQMTGICLLCSLLFCATGPLRGPNCLCRDCRFWDTGKASSKAREGGLPRLGASDPNYWGMSSSGWQSRHVCHSASAQTSAQRIHRLNMCGLAVSTGTWFFLFPLWCLQPIFLLCRSRAARNLGLLGSCLCPRIPNTSEIQNHSATSAPCLSVDSWLSKWTEDLLLQLRWVWGRFLWSAWAVWGVETQTKRAWFGRGKVRTLDR